MTTAASTFTQTLNMVTELQSTVATLGDQNYRLRWAISELLDMIDPETLSSDLRALISDLIGQVA